MNANLHLLSFEVPEVFALSKLAAKRLKALAFF